MLFSLLIGHLNVEDTVKDSKEDLEVRRHNTWKETEFLSYNVKESHLTFIGL